MDRVLKTLERSCNGHCKFTSCFLRVILLNVYANLCLVLSCALLRDVNADSRTSYLITRIGIDFAVKGSTFNAYLPRNAYGDLHGVVTPVELCNILEEIMANMSDCVRLGVACVPQCGVHDSWTR